MTSDLRAVLRRSSAAGATTAVPIADLSVGFASGSQPFTRRDGKRLERRLGRAIVLGYAAGAATLGAMLAIAKTLGVL